jgi:1,4-dihydroxy-2-naphthoate octaprenyltransferase
VPSLVVVGVGQGALAFLGAWAARRGEVASAWSPAGVAGALAATLLIVGLYPLTQLYQVQEDRARGDWTLAVAWGPRACFAVALVCQAAGGLALLAVLYGRYGAADAALVGVALLAQLGAVARWAASFDEQRVLPNFRRAMRLNMLSAGGLALYLGYRLLQP